MNAFNWLCVLLQPATWFALIIFGVWLQRDHAEARRQLDELTIRLAKLAELVVRDEEIPAPPNSPSVLAEEPQLPTAIARYRA